MQESNPFRFERERAEAGVLLRSAEAGVLLRSDEITEAKLVKAVFSSILIENYTEK